MGRAQRVGDAARRGPSASSAVIDALLDEPRGVALAHGRLRLDPLRHERLGVRRVVLLLVAEPAVADEVDHEVVAELGAVGEREPDRAERGLGIVGVDVDDRDVEALREVARVARRAALGGIGRVADLVVRDQVQRAAGRVALEALQVERLGDDALARRTTRRRGSARAARRSGRGGRRRSERSVCSARARPSTTGSTASRWLGFGAISTSISPGARQPAPRRGKVVLDVAAAALGVDHERVVASARPRTRGGSTRTSGRRCGRGR